MKKVLATMVMALFLCATCTMRVEATVIPTDIEVPNQEEQQSIVIQIVHTDLIDRKIVKPYYVVTKEGETIETIASRLRLTEEYLLSANEDYKNPEEPFALYAYVELPETDWSEVAEGVYYYVSYGDNLRKISEYFETDVSSICELNPQIKSPNLIYAENLIRVK